MKCAIAIFAKTIGLSPVKTRLANDIGTGRAETFFRMSVACVEETVSEASERNQELFPHWALAEEEAPALKQWSSFPAIWTGEGGLGARLANVSETLLQDHDAVMLIGTDSPQLRPEIFGQVLDLLSAFPEDCVAGPARDGGFYLFGSARPLGRKIWEAVSYSQDTTLKSLQSQIELCDRKVRHLGVEEDVDTIESLASLRKSLSQSLPNLFASQRKLLDWLNDESEGR
ncbi:MAG: DUF2064 domain-containing protein [Pseudomonadota bacterium]